MEKYKPSYNSISSITRDNGIFIFNKYKLRSEFKDALSITKTKGLIVDQIYEDLEEEYSTLRREIINKQKKDTKIDPLEWWASNEEKYPILLIIARQYLVIPATIAAIEEGVKEF
ncbi:hypothetical protein ACRALDRAFT_1070436 [Sodiomyces alcalophilus JCM 7366]|uniref:uncharacterized protein n=1 Tax=Sodiomyces alcalophilus JCM 7366 TaxID=591952 RepID=UPI0039B5DDE3